MKTLLIVAFIFLFLVASLTLKWDLKKRGYTTNLIFLVNPQDLTNAMEFYRRTDLSRLKWLYGICIIIIATSVIGIMVIFFRGL